MTLGFYENELVRRTDPKHRSIGRFFAEEVAAPLGIEFYIGLPDDVSLSRIGTLEVNSNKLAWVVGTLKDNPRAIGMVLGFMNSDSLTSRVLNSPLMVQGADYSNPAYRGIEFAGMGGSGKHVLSRGRTARWRRAAANWASRPPRWLRSKLRQLRPPVATQTWCWARLSSIRSDLGSRMTT